VLGIGWGGYQALVAAETSPAWRCAGAINAVSDPATYAAWLADQQVKPEQDQITALAADPQWPRAFAPNAASPGVVALYAGADTGAPSAVKAAGSLGVPVLLVSAKGDKIVPPSQGNALHDALLAAHKDVQAVAYGGADHALAGHDARLATLTAVLDFLAKADPAD
jgi:dipeptidyl aminopeptidase/acylaminoacyl peptidase